MNLFRVVYKLQTLFSLFKFHPNNMCFKQNKKYSNKMPKFFACSFTVSNICFFAVDCVFSLCSRIGIYVLCTHTRLYVDACEAPRDRIRTVNCAFQANFNVHFTPIILASLRFDFVYSFESNDLTVKKVAWL